MHANDLLQRIAKGEFHQRGALNCAELFTVDPDFFSSLKDELQTLVSRNAPSEVQDKAHPANWAKPIGKSIQFELLNKTGDFSHTSELSSKTVHGKRFHHAADYRTIADFIAMFPHTTDMRLRGMGPNSELSPHEVNSAWREGRRWYFVGRFHLPIVTNPDALVLFEGELVHLQAGRIYFFNNGCIHSAFNGGETDRYHLVWDMLLTQEAVDFMFGDESHFPLVRTPEGSRDVPVIKSVSVGEYVVVAAQAYHRRLRLERLKVDQHRFAKLFLKARRTLYRCGGRPTLIEAP